MPPPPIRPPAPSRRRPTRHRPAAPWSSLVGALLPLLLASAAWGSTPRPGATERFALVWDRTANAETGAINVGARLRGADLGLSWLTAHTARWPAWGRLSARVGRFVLADGPLALGAVWFQHEAFGHAARARDLGIEATAHVAIPPPYGFDVYSNRTSWSQQAEWRHPPDARTSLMTEGQEAEVLLERQLVREALLGRRWGPTLCAVWMVRLLGDTKRLQLEGDWSTYRADVRARWGQAAFVADWPAWTRMVVDPVGWWALWRWGRWLLTGAHPGQPPHLDLGSARVLPRPALRLAPWGLEPGLLVHAALPTGYAQAEAALGPRQGAPSLYVSAHLTVFEARRDLDLGATLRGWSQPAHAVGLGGPETMQLGGAAEIEATLWGLDWLGLSIAGGAKTHGWVVGRSWHAGVFTRVGLALRRGADRP